MHGQTSKECDEETNIKQDVKIVLTSFLGTNLRRISPLTKRQASSRSFHTSPSGAGTDELRLRLCRFGLLLSHCPRNVGSAAWNVQ